MHPIVIVVKEMEFVVQHYMGPLAVGTDLLIVGWFQILLVQGILLLLFLSYSVYSCLVCVMLIWASLVHRFCDFCNFGDYGF